MAVQGADLGQLQGLVSQLAGPFQSELTSCLNKMNSTVQQSNSYWVAKNADHFRTEFAQFVSKCESQLQQILQDASKATNIHLHNVANAVGEHI